MTNHTKNDHIPDEEFTIAVEDVVEIPVKFTMKSGSLNKTFSFMLYGKRKTQEEIDEEIENKKRTVIDFLREQLTDWKDQRFVLGADGKPALFSPQALNAMLNAQGVHRVIWAAYLTECGAKEKN